MNAVVTGAGRGMGLAFCKQLVADGYTVFGTVRGRAQALDGTGVTVLKLDVADTVSIGVFAAQLATTVGRVDLLVNNAGMNSRSAAKGQKNVRWGDLEPEGMLNMMRVNAIGPVLVTQALSSLLGEDSRVLNVSSGLGSIGGKTSGGNYGYCASKATLNMLARAMAFDLAKRGVVSVCLNPGWVQTDMGGPKAPLTAEDSVRGMLRVMNAATPDDAGGFFNHDGTPAEF